MNNGFEVGDLVMLKSGGPRMTIQDIGEFGYDGDGFSAQCVWFENSILRKKDVFKFPTLVKVTDASIA